MVGDSGGHDRKGEASSLVTERGWGRIRISNWNEGAGKYTGVGRGFVVWNIAPSFVVVKSGWNGRVLITSGV